MKTTILNTSITVPVQKKISTKIISFSTTSEQEMTIQIAPSFLDDKEQANEILFLITDETGKKKKELFATISIQTLKDLIPEFELIVSENT